MSSSLYSGVSGLAIGTGLYKGAAGLWGNSSGLISGWGGFSPLALFTAGEQGFIYDPSDFSTLYQDPAGTTPVTAVGQTVGLLLDKSKGLVLGPELVTNGDFSGGSTGWSLGAGCTVASGQATFTASGINVTLIQTSRPSATYGALYRIDYTIISNTLNAGEFRVGGLAGSSYFANLFNLPKTIGANTIYVFARTSGAANAFDFYITPSATSGSLVVDNISVRELPGNHATQSVLASRPILAREPLGGRRNLLTWTEQFDNAAWQRFNSTITPNAIAAPDGTLTADTLVEDTTNAAHVMQQSATLTAAAHTFSVYLKAKERTWAQVLNGTIASGFAYFNLSTGAVGTVGAGVTATSITSVGNGWYRCSITFTASSGGNILAVRTASANGTGSYLGDGTSGIFIWGAQLETGSTATAYQRVTSTYDVTEAGKADLYYLLFDGSDDFLVTNTITPGTDKAQVFAGVRKLSDSGALVELSTNAAINNGAFLAYATSSSTGTGPTYSFVSKGSTDARNAIAPNNYSAPITNVFTGTGNIAGDSVILRLNGSEVATNTSDQGTGNYLAYPAYIGRRGGTSLPFNGRIYSLIVRFGANLTAAQIAQTEAWVNSRTGAY